MSLAGFKPAVPTSERPQTHTLDRAATRIGNEIFTAGSYKLALPLLLLIHRFSERNATRFLLAAKLFLC
jgi:hypothetical protein